MEMEDVHKSHTKMPSALAALDDSQPPVTATREESDSKAKLPAIGPLETRDLRSQTPEMSLPKPSPTAGVLAQKKMRKAEEADQSHQAIGFNKKAA
jgi:hypothetical protein